MKTLIEPDGKAVPTGPVDEEGTRLSANNDLYDMDITWYENEAPKVSHRWTAEIIRD